MKLRSLVVVVGMALAPVLTPVLAHAQTGLYINPVAIRVTNSVADHGTYAFLGQNSTEAMFWGVDFGAYYDFKTPYPFKAGLDLRESILHGNSAKLDSFLVGIRFSGKPFANKAWKPYIEPVVGTGTTSAPYTGLHINKVEYGALAGLDYETHHHIDFRVIEVGYTGLITASSETIGATSPTPIPTSDLLNISAGIVLRFP